ncbi:MAG: SIS domain-containing protein, partial [Calditrichaeota bacterium]|nr:SIS domain-containing protein [Calditrichota bacterium]
MDRSAVNQVIKDNVRENIAVKQEILSQMIQPVAQAAEKLVDCLHGGGKLLFCGNGGSAADAQHLAAELVVRLRSAVERPALPALALTVDSSVLTAGGNDYGFTQVFSRQIEALGHPGDVLIAISTSGNSPNVIAA